MRRPVIALISSLCALAIPSTAAAQDAPLALVEALDAHLLDCPATNGYQPDGDMLSPDWVPFEGEDPVLAARAAELTASSKSGRSNVNIFTKEAHGYKLIQFLSLRITEGEGDDLEVSENLDAPYITGVGPLSEASSAYASSKGASARFLCVTIIPDLPFMPSGKLLSAIFGEEVDVGFANTPGTLRDGTWIWDDLSPTHLRTLARYTNEYTGQSDLPDSVFYPGFYILSLRKFTPEFPDPDTRPYPVADVVSLVQNTCAALPDAEEARDHFYDLDWYSTGESSHPGALGLRKLQEGRAQGFDAYAPQFVDVIQQDEGGETLYASIVIAQKNGEPVRECTVYDFDEERTLPNDAVVGTGLLSISYFRPNLTGDKTGLLSGIEFIAIFQDIDKEGDAQ